MAARAESRLTTLKLISFVLVVAWLVIAAFPFLWTVWGSFKVQGDFFSKADWTMRFIEVFTTVKLVVRLHLAAITGPGSRRILAQCL